MKHTKNYMDAMWVIENPERYDDRDVVRANSFIEAYNEGYSQALSSGAVSKSFYCYNKEKGFNNSLCKVKQCQKCKKVDKQCSDNMFD